MTAAGLSVVVLPPSTLMKRHTALRELQVIDAGHQGHRRRHGSKRSMLLAGFGIDDAGADSTSSLASTFSSPGSIVVVSPERTSIPFQLPGPNLTS